MNGMGLIGNLRKNIVHETHRCIRRAERIEKAGELPELGGASPRLGALDHQPGQAVAIVRRQGVVEGALQQRVEFGADHRSSSVACSFQPSSSSPRSCRAVYKRDFTVFSGMASASAISP